MKNLKMNFLEKEEMNEVFGGASKKQPGSGIACSCICHCNPNGPFEQQNKGRDIQWVFESWGSWGLATPWVINDR